MKHRETRCRDVGEGGSTFPTERSMEANAGYGNMLFAIILKKLRSSAKRRAYIPPGQISRAMRANPGVPLPPEIHIYLCDLLEGKIKAPPGRPTDSENLLVYIKKALIPSVYEKYFVWLKRRHKAKGLEGWYPIRDTDWWQGPPSERAARMTVRRLGLAMDWPRVRNIVSEAKK